MKNVPENELFSAYLDGELTADEQAQMERLLAGSESARKLLEDLRAQANLLQSLPRIGVPVDLSERILGEIAGRKSMERQDPAPLQTAGSEPEPIPSIVSVSRDQAPSQIWPSSDANTPWNPAAILRRLARPRNLGWALIAASLAAVIFLMDVARQFHDRREGNLAFAPNQEAPATSPVDSSLEMPPLPADTSMGAAEAARGAAPETGTLAVARSRGTANNDLPSPEVMVSNHPDAPPSGQRVATMGANAIEGVAPSEAEMTAVPDESGGSVGGRMASPATVPAPLTADALAARGPAPGGDEQVSILRQYEVRGLPQMPQMPQAIPVEIVCRLMPQADPHAVAARVVQRRNSVPDATDSYSGWEFAAAQTPAPGPGALSRRSAARAAPPPDDVTQKSHSPQQMPLGPGIRIHDESGEGDGAVIVEFTGTLPQIEAVLAELEREPDQVAQITLPTSLGLVQDRIRRAARTPTSAEGAEALRSGPMAAIPPARLGASASADSVPDQRADFPAPSDGPSRQTDTSSLYRVTIRLLPSAPQAGGPSQDPGPSPTPEKR